jgi:hypothetical protein
MFGSMSIVLSEASRGAPNSRCDVIPEPCPITAAVRAPGAWASVTSGRRSCVTWSPVTGWRTVSPGAGRIQSSDSDASGLPLVASVSVRDSRWRRTLTVAVRPSA